MKFRTKITLLCLLLTLGLLCGACAVYLGSYYKADTAAIGAFLPEGTAFTETADGDIVIGPQNAQTAFLFYPGGKVEHTAYLPLMQLLAEQDILCIIVKMPFRLAVLDINAAKDIQKEYPSVQNWYIGGHSLGGAMAASYLAKHPADFKGLVLLAAYSTKDISHAGCRVLSLYGSEDRVLNAQKYAENKKNLPDDFTEIVIDGGCHAYFGMYGNQKGDGTPSLSPATQIAITANAILEMIGPLC